MIDGGGGGRRRGRIGTVYHTRIQHTPPVYWCWCLPHLEYIDLVE